MYQSSVLRIPPEMILCVVTALTYCLAKASPVVVFSQEIRAQIERPERAGSSSDDQPIILSTPSRISVPAGTTVVFPCRIDRDLVGTVLVWKREKTRKTGIIFTGDLRVDKDKRFSLINGTTLQIEDVTPSYAGEYTCQLRTTPLSEVVHHLFVLVPPKIRIDPEDGQVVVKEGDHIVVRCQADGYPQPTITWTAVDGYLPGRVKEMQGSVLSIASADVRHTGYYQCTADNDVEPPSTATVRITVLYAPQVTVKPTWLHAGLGSSAEFRCVATGEPTPTLFWTRTPGTVLDEDNHISFERRSNNSHEELTIKIRRITQEHFGSYACFANNSINSTFRTAQISGLAEPVKFKSHADGKMNESFLLTWTVKSHSPVIEYLLRIRSLQQSNFMNKASPWIDVMIPVDAQQSVLHSHSYNITGLTPGTKYEAVMQARNDFGWNHPSEAFVFHTVNGLQSDELERITTDVSLLPVVMTDMSPSEFGSDNISGQQENKQTIIQPGLLLQVFLLSILLTR